MVRFTSPIHLVHECSVCVVCLSRTRWSLWMRKIWWFSEWGNIGRRWIHERENLNFNAVLQIFILCITMLVSAKGLGMACIFASRMRLLLSHSLRPWPKLSRSSKPLDCRQSSSLCPSNRPFNVFVCFGASDAIIFVFAHLTRRMLQGIESSRDTGQAIASVLCVSVVVHWKWF